MIRTIILLLVGGTLLTLALVRLRQQKLKERYALIFGLAGIPFLLMAIWPDMIGNISRMMGIEYATVMLLCVSMFLILMVFELLSIVSVQDRKIATLAQMVGILMEKQRADEPIEARPDADVLHIEAKADPQEVGRPELEIHAASLRGRGFDQIPIKRITR